MRRKEEERDEQKAKMMINVELLAKHMLGTGQKPINTVGAHNTPLLEGEVVYALFDDDIRYLENQGSDSRMGYQSTNIGPWHPRDESKGWRYRDGPWNDQYKQWREQYCARGDYRYNHRSSKSYVPP